ncbi:hypothetical protein [Oscillatoria sp. FACHB-1407]|uniref:hypothetical protein n=1 Tax=Oscillatoria sp. FACHB-1407 TaxID=2692847 RepID=UPI0018EFFBA8|nr:hypothetical protein [Oscillatoria sp. FACHB-1407]
MLLIHLVQDMPTLLAVSPDSDFWNLLWHPHLDWSLLAQQFETDVFANARRSFDNFVKSGQLWALLIGLVIGYLVRSFTSYG